LAHENNDTLNSGVTTVWLESMLSASRTSFRRMLFGGYSREMSNLLLVKESSVLLSETITSLKFLFFITD
jgi:hypothetical protein